jgi:uncharacterized RDD family membrane protein YckC
VSERSAGEPPAKGATLGLPADGPGSVASLSRRALGFLLDLAAGALIGGLVNRVVVDPDALQRTLAVNGAFAVEVIVLVALTGQSLGMRLAGLRVLRPASPGGLPGFLPTVVRTGLLMLVLPAVVTDKDGRGLHDLAAGTVVVRAG